MLPPFGTPPVGEMDEAQRLDNEAAKRFKINPSSVPAYRPPSERGTGGAQGDEMSLEKAQLYVNKFFPNTVEGATRQQLDGLEKLKNDVARIERGEPISEREIERIDQAERNQMAYYQGQLQGLQNFGEVSKGHAIFNVDADHPQEYKAWEDGQAEMQTRLYFGSDVNIGEAAKAAPIQLPTDTLSKTGDTATAISYGQNGDKIEHSYRMEGDRVIHSHPNGYEKSMTVAESRAYQADRAANVNKNTANMLESMKTDPSMKIRQGGNTYSVEGQNLVRVDAQGNRGVMPLAKMERNLKSRQDELTELQKTTKESLKADNRQRGKIQNMLEKQKEVGNKPEHITYDKYRNPTKWTLDDKGKLHSEKVPKSTVVDLNSATAKLNERITAAKDAQAFNGMNTVVNRLREKEQEQGKGATLTNPHNGDVNRLSEDGKTLHCVDKNNNARPDADAQRSHEQQLKYNAAMALQEDNERKV